MNYTNRKDGGAYISSNKKKVTVYNTNLVQPIGYVEEVVEFASKNKIKYRDAYLISTEGIKDKEAYLKEAKNRF